MQNENKNETKTIYVSSKDGEGLSLDEILRKAKEQNLQQTQSKIENEDAKEKIGEMLYMANSRRFNEELYKENKKFEQFDELKYYGILVIIVIFFALVIKYPAWVVVIGAILVVGIRLFICFYKHEMSFKEALWNSKLYLIASVLAIVVKLVATIYYGIQKAERKQNARRKQ